MLIRRAEIGRRGHARERSVCDVRVDGAAVTEVAPTLGVRAGEAVVDAEGGALLPGLHDHHLHLFALASAGESVACGPPAVRDAAALEAALRARAVGLEAPAWIRGVGYHESVAGMLDRRVLDRMVPRHPLRIQHRSGSAWFVNSPAIARLALDAGRDAPGVERDEHGRATGALFRCDELLRRWIGPEAPPSLAAVSRRLARYGVTGVTDAGAHNGEAEIDAFAGAIGRGDVVQRICAMGRADRERPARDPAERLTYGSQKILLDERDLPPLDALADAVARADSDARGVAIHCVTRAELVLACAALVEARPRRPGLRARIEHASVAPPDVVALLAELGAIVVTQPGLVHARGDAYLTDVEPRDRPWLYRVRGFLDGGVGVAGSTDAPFGDPDPWTAMRAAVTRTTAGGLALGTDERVTPEQALRLFTTDARRPAGEARVVEAGPADLCLLDRPWSEAREALSSEVVRATMCAGRIVWER